MELALYCPQHGYYELKKDTLGRKGDFYTSVGVGNLFGRLLAGQFAGWLTAAGGDRPQIVEAGAHDGRLAADILGWLREWRPELYERLEYVIIEPSPNRRAWQQETLGELGTQVRWRENLPEPGGADGGFSGIIFSNELLDAFPVHRLGWDARAQHWFEWGVTAAADGFVWARLPGAFPVADLAPGLMELPAELQAVLPDGYVVEVAPAAVQWWRQAALALRAGKLLALDYGLAASELFIPERTTGTLRAYHQHQVSADLLAQPGEQDLTAHVNFTALEIAGRNAGLAPDGLQTQAQFLTRIAAEVWRQPEQFGGWGPRETRQFQTLTHPEHLGRAFRVLVQSRIQPDSVGSNLASAGGV
ncbi:MAG TPA: SAM-dependent methyltransferase [Dongiaceae bacterium]|nr:SAM-dependent methyltransferase [Dongiaceae bacterium]